MIFPRKVNRSKLRISQHHLGNTDRFFFCISIGEGQAMESKGNSVLKLSLMYLQYSQNNELIQCTNIHHSTAKIAPSKSNGSVKIVFLLLLQSICAHHQWKKIRLDLFKHCFPSSYLPFWLQVPMPRFTNSETCVKACIIKWAENLPGNVVESRIRICH